MINILDGSISTAPLTPMTRRPKCHIKLTSNTEAGRTHADKLTLTPIDLKPSMTIFRPIRSKPARDPNAPRGRVYTFTGLDDLPTRDQTQSAPFLISSIPTAPALVCRGEDQCFKCTGFGHWRAGCNRRTPKGAEDLKNWCLVEVRPGISKAYFLGTLWPSLMTPEKVVQATVTHLATSSSSVLHPSPIAVTPSISKGELSSKRKLELESALVIREALWRPKSCSDLKDETLL
ncbi:uncharacterized protein MELLADRAFT_108171 [Melampsora larici-populina 98AG31]|uniref:Uncharacterized protein n=1 Tax=Melampsora larici-populina (strain 98AG31 / pathotype 3-4-7) TaxID=747676 RepID=F4RS78_MELLP|nr:uncharacterized protein MELLADRAFT_108171 [Melampsora larici-populina 98AG31]EGG04826.1 hypothetical protein MELLADRAFT_108171 [Melampsora larici-populina 98AG31]